MNKMTTALSLVAILATGVQAVSLEDRVKALEEQNTVLTEEVLASQSAGFTRIDTEKSYNGMGAAASKVYYSESPLSIGGYGEMFYANPDDGDDFTDVYRFITYFGYRFNDWLILNAEIEYEHGATSQKGGSVVVEFLYLDFLLSKEFSLRVGNQLVPMGMVNLRHEPTLFNTVQRPEIERQLIPSTWHETGVVAYGRFDDIGIEYTAGLINGLNVDNDKAKEGKSGWIRSGRIGTQKNGSYQPAFVGRIDYTGINGLVTGASMYYGTGSNGADTKTSGLTTTMFDVHTRYENGPFAAYGLYTQTNLSGVENFGTPDAVEKASGYYMNASYDLGAVIGIDYKMPIFAQYENWNPVEKTLSGVNEDAFDTETVTIGMNFFPTSQTVLKLDYEMDKVGTVDTNTLSFGLGFIF
ncbi:MAG: hypothetical protein Q9M39_01835 [Sulfurovum sp.]|nr:hypothetical protein [Sulfurovum sp.]